MKRLTGVAVPVRAENVKAEWVRSVTGLRWHALLSDRTAWCGQQVERLTAPERAPKMPTGGQACRSCLERYAARARAEGREP